MAFTSTILESVSARGRKRFTFKHVENGLTLGPFVEFVANETMEADWLAANLASHVAAMKQAEIDANLSKALNGETNTFIFARSTVAANRTALRELFAVATKWELVTLGYVIHTMNLTDNQLKNLFQVNDAQLPALKTKLANQSQKYQDVLDEVSQ